MRLPPGTVIVVAGKVMVVFPIRVWTTPTPAPTNGANGPGFGRPRPARSTKPASIPETDDSLALTSSRL